MRELREWLWLYVATGVALVGSVLLVIHSPVLGLTGLATAVGLVIALREPDRMAGILLVASLLLFRPSAFAQAHGTTFLGIGLCAAAALFALFADVRGEREMKLDRQSVQATILPITLWLWLLMLGLVRPDYGSADIAKGALAVGVAVVATLLVFRDRDRGRRTARLFLWLLVALAGSAAITLALAAVGVPPERLAMGHLKLYPNFTGESPIGFPLTTVSGTFSLFGRALPRATGFMREPGLFPLFLAWAFFMAPLLTTRRLVRVVLVLGIFACGSTAGFASFAGALAYDLFLQRRGGRNLPLRRLAGLIVVPYTLYFIINAPGYGYSAKSTSNLASVEDRSGAARAGLRAMADHPFFGAPGEGINSAINLLGAAGQISLIGLVLAVLAYLLPVVSAPQYRRRYSAPAVFCAFIVSLTAQPLLDAPAVWMLCVAAAACTAWVPHPETAAATAPHARRNVSRAGHWQPQAAATAQQSGVM